MRSLRLALPLLCSILSACSSSRAVDLQGQPPPQEYPPGPSGPPPDQVAHAMMFWLPNRFFDIFDIVRARLRVGPGFTFSARATEMLDVNLGAHEAVFLGIHGPRGMPVIPWPVGFEQFSGVEIGPADATNESGYLGPHYGYLEFGLGLQLLIVGVDVGVDPWEILDFFGGIVLLDPAHDDF